MPEPKIIEGQARRRRPLSKPLAWLFVAAGLAMLAWLFWTRDAGSTATLFGATAMIACAVGALLAAIFRDFE